MAVAVNTAEIAFNGGQPLPYTWTYGGDGDGLARGISGLGFWSDPAGGELLAATPLTPAVSFSRGRPAAFEAGAIRLEQPHSAAQDLWRRRNAEFGGEYTLRGALMAMEGILSGGATMGPAPAQGRVYVGLHRTVFQASNLASAVVSSITTPISLRSEIPVEVDDYLRLSGATSAQDEIVRVLTVLGPTLLLVARGQPGHNGLDTTPGEFGVGTRVRLMDAPRIENELVNAGDALPGNPVAGERFLFRADATGLTNAVDGEGDSVTAASARQEFRYNGATWVRQAQNDRLLPDFGAPGYARVEVVRDALMVDGAAAAYTDAASIMSNVSGWTLSAE